MLAAARRGRCRTSPRHGAGRLEPRDALLLLRLGNDHQEPALHLLASRVDPRGLVEYGHLLLDLHDRRQITRDELAQALLQNWRGETLLQRALMRGSPATVKACFALLGEGLQRDAIDEAALRAALTAPRFPGFPARACPPSPFDIPLHLPFATATLPCMRAIIDGVDLLRQTGKLRPAALRELMAPSFRLTGAAVVGTDGMSDELARATALVAKVRRRWSDAASHGRGPD